MGTEQSKRPPRVHRIVRQPDTLSPQERDSIQSALEKAAMHALDTGHILAELVSVLNQAPQATRQQMLEWLYRCSTIRVGRGIPPPLYVGRYQKVNRGALKQFGSATPYWRINAPQFSGDRSGVKTPRNWMSTSDLAKQIRAATRRLLRYPKELSQESLADLCATYGRQFGSITGGRVLILDHADKALKELIPDECDELVKNVVEEFLKTPSDACQKQVAGVTEAFVRLRMPNRSRPYVPVAQGGLPSLGKHAR